ncbi:SGNH/GDSL hydrolase family protein [Ruminococcus sp.]|uniref:SGNH/GDSL hydrolase family protein n=1 Tax=Ruminococcus sp. TaxID=41978 RepID=UPI0025DFFCFF|nr:SGNH/GDSL hydrolase family protein [Ruminococcus sp.]
MKKIQFDKYTKTVGRTYFKDGVMWLGLSGTGAEFDFCGEKLTLTFIGDSIATDSGTTEQSRMAVYIDGERVLDEMVRYDRKSFDIVRSKKSCTVKIVKLTESPMSAVGVVAEADDKALIAKSADKKLKIEFIGDSITCGYGVDDEDAEHQFSTDTEDVTKAYAYKTAQALDADYSMFSASGYGIISGYTEGDVPYSEETIPQFYDSYGYSRGDFGGEKPQDIKWDFDRFVPQIIVINLGTNDDSYCRDYADRQQGFSKLYAEFLETVRSRNPQAYILCTVGIMGERIFASVEKALELYLSKNDDKRISAMKFTEQDGANDGFAANWHPTAKTHTKAAQVLVEKLNDIIMAEDIG